MFSFPQKIYIKNGLDHTIVDLLKSMNIGKTCTIITSSDIMKITGNKLKSIIEKQFSVKELILESNDKQYVESFLEKIQDSDFLIGVGGGKTIDATKYLASLLKKHWVAFPTILSHDGVVSSRAIISNGKNKISIQASEPSAIIADISVIKSAPYKYIAAGVGDLISNITAVEDWKIADKFGKEKYHASMAKLSLLSAEAVIENVDEIRKMSDHGLEVLLWSLICSGFAMNIYGSSRPCSGSEHNFSHALDELGSNALHGEQVALGTVISSYLQGKDWKNILLVLKDFGLPTSASELGISKDILIKAIVNAKDVRERFTVLNTINIDENKAEEICKKVGII